MLTLNSIQVLIRMAGLMLSAVLITEKSLSAYTDPGSGTLAWQILVGGLVGLSFEMKRIRRWVARKFHDGNDHDSAQK